VQTRGKEHWPSPAAYSLGITTIAGKRAVGCGLARAEQDTYLDMEEKHARTVPPPEMSYAPPFQPSFSSLYSTGGKLTSETARGFIQDDLCPAPGPGHYETVGNIAAIPGGRISSSRAKNDDEWHFYETRLKPDAGTLKYLVSTPWVRSHLFFSPRRDSAGHDVDTT
jgi:hypothetical protein